MGDFAIVWLEQDKGPCVFCEDKTGVGAVGWHQAEPVGTVCDACMLERENILGVELKKARAPRNECSAVWPEQAQGPCVFCADETGVGAVGWHHTRPVGPICDACMLDRERILGLLLRTARAQDSGDVIVN